VTRDQVLRLLESVRKELAEEAREAGGNQANRCRQLTAIIDVVAAIPWAEPQAPEGR
jgi:hypothetical protein